MTEKESEDKKNMVVNPYKVEGEVDYDRLIKYEDIEPFNKETIPTSDLEDKLFIGSLYTGVSGFNYFVIYLNLIYLK